MDGKISSAQKYELENKYKQMVHNKFGKYVDVNKNVYSPKKIQPKSSKNSVTRREFSSSQK